MLNDDEECCGLSKQISFFLSYAAAAAGKHTSASKHIMRDKLSPAYVYMRDDINNSTSYRCRHCRLHAASLLVCLHSSKQHSICGFKLFFLKSNNITDYRFLEIPFMLT